MGRNFRSAGSKSTGERSSVADLLVDRDVELGSCWNSQWLTGHGAAGARHGAPAMGAEGAVEVGKV
jgi:hypothetical protein